MKRHQVSGAIPRRHAGGRAGSRLGRCLAAAAAIALAGCVSVQANGVGTSTGQAAFDLSGTDLAALGTEAGRLCPQGYDVVRQWSRYGRAGGDSAGDPTSAALWAWAFSYDTPPPQARMSILCRS